MKKQINPTIKAHLIRSAFYVLLLLAVCVIPFALARERSHRTAKRSVAAANVNRSLSPYASLSVLAPKPTGIDAAASGLGAPTQKQLLQGKKGPRQPSGDVLWYNGDFNGINGLANEQNTLVGQSSIYDNFIVPAPGWHVTGVFSDNLLNTTVTGANWEIRSGVSEGNGGTVVASGTTTTPVVAPTGRSGFGFTEFMVEVTGLSVDLAPGTYWLNVTPIGNGGGRSFDSDTSGTNCVGLPCGNDDNAFINSSDFGFVFHNTSSGDVGQPDFSMGVEGTVGGGGTPSPTPTGSPTPTPTPVGCATCNNYNTASGADKIVPGTTDIGNHCDDCTSPVTLPFPVCVYGTTFTSANVESNGTLQFTGNTAFFASGCNPLPNPNYVRTLFPYYDDLSTDPAVSPDCSNFTSGCGVFTSVTGTAPNREFHIEWRTGYFGRDGTANFEVRLSESSSDINVVYGSTVDNGGLETSGIQASSGGPATQFSCGDSTLTSGLKVTYTCGVSSPTPTPTATATCPPGGGNGPSGPLWYNGDFNGVNGLANEMNTLVGQSSIYDNFIVPGPGWHITSIFSDNLLNTNVTGATWEIRSGVTEGNGGTVVASGTTTTPVVTPTGRSGFGFTEFMVEITGLSVDLAPGTYWLNVTPVGDGSGRSFDSDTSGTNCVGLPCGNDDNAFINSSDFGFVFHNTSSGDVGQPDFSMGVNGTIQGGGCVTPTPSPTPTATPTCPPGGGNGPSGPLWYNGDFNGVNGLANEMNTLVGQSSIYDNFIVPGPGWHITSIFSDNLLNTNVTGATWEIRSGVTEGNGGTVVASGTTTTPVVTPTGRSGFGFTEFMVEITGLSVDLAPGTYWLNVTPVGDGSGRSFDSDTSGTNCVGLPCGNDDNAFINSSDFGFVFHNTSSGDVGQPDFSMGVNGTIQGGGCPNGNANSDGYSDGNGDGNGNGNCYCYSNSNSYCYSYGNGNGYCYHHADEDFTDAKAATHTASTPISSSD